MTEKLSGFVEDTPRHRVEDARQEEINKLYDERQKLIAQGVADDDKRILILSQRLTELTAPGAAQKFRELESILASPFNDGGETESIAAPSSADDTDKLVEHALREVDSPETEQKTPDAGEQISEAAKYIREKSKKIVDLRRELVLNIVPKIAGEVKKIIISQIHQWDMDYNEFQQEVNTYEHKEDLVKVRAEFEMFFNTWYDRLSLIYQEASKNLDKK
ncbi:MAG: hypothetical protein WCV69_00895 [Patescibacteria group bacterium]|jgi:hypothetical protein